jgi:hypothetical protein
MLSKNRNALVSTMGTLLEAARSDAQIDLSFDNLAKTAGVSRATAYRDPELRKEWNKRVAKHLLDQGRPSKTLTAAQRAERRDASVQSLRATIAIMANHIQALSLTVMRLEAENKSKQDIGDQRPKLSLSS